MITLEYFNGTEWVHAGEYPQEWMAWVALGGDDRNYRTIDSEGNILTTKLDGEDTQI